MSSILSFLLSLHISIHKPTTSFNLSKNELIFFFQNRINYNIYIVLDIDGATSYSVINFEDIKEMALRETEAVILIS